MLNELQQAIFAETTQDGIINLSGIDHLTVEQTADHLKSPSGFTRLVVRRYSNHCHVVCGKRSRS